MTNAIYRGPTRGYTLTDDDVLWLARAFVGEAGENCTREEAEYHFYCWLDRFLLVRKRWLTEAWSFAALLRAHSQPINPLWATAGAGKCAEKDPNGVKECDAGHISRRAYIRSLSVSQLTSFGVYQYALEAQAGTLRRRKSYPLYDFASSGTVEGQRRPCTGILVGGQRFLPYECLTADEKSTVLKNENGTLAKVEGGLKVSSIGKIAIGVLFGTAVLWAAWTLYTKRKER